MREPDRRFGMRGDTRDGNLMLYGLVGAALVLLLAVAFWPRSENRPGVATSDTSTRVERNVPANKPVTTPTPMKPAQ